MILNSLLTRKPTAIHGLLLVLLFCGCGSSNPWETAHPVNGSILYKGKPIKDAELVFFPLDEKFPESVRPWAKSKENGEFALSTYDREDGAPAGKYKVTVVHHEVVVKGPAIAAKPNDLPKKYAKKDTTDLIVEVPRGGTSLPVIELK